MKSSRHYLDQEATDPGHDDKRTHHPHDPMAVDAPGRQQLRLLLTPAEAAHALGISRAALYPLLMTREIASLKIGGSRRIPLAALEHYIEEHLSRWDEVAQAGQMECDDDDGTVRHRPRVVSEERKVDAR